MGAGGKRVGTAPHAAGGCDWHLGIGSLLFTGTTGTNAQNAVVSVVAMVGVNSTQKQPSQCRITRRLSRTLIVMRERSGGTKPVIRASLDWRRGNGGVDGSGVRRV